MNTRYPKDYEHRQLRKRLWFIEAIIFMLAMLLAGVSQAQDVTPPSVVTLNPADDAIQIPADQWTFEITFDEDVQVDLTVTHPIAIWDNMGFDQASLFVGSSGISISGATVTIDFNHDGSLNGTPLEDDSEYEITIPTGFFEDPSGNGFAGFSLGSGFWTITTEDTIEPEITSRTPSISATGVLVNVEFVMQFDEDIIKGTGSISLYDDTGLVESVDVDDASITVNGNELVWTRSSFLNAGTDYYLTVPEGMVTDIFGNEHEGFTAPTAWPFTTQDDESDPPVITSTGPADDATNVSLGDIEEDGLYFSFDESVVLGTGNIEIRATADDALIQSISVTGGDVQADGEEGTTEDIQINNISIPYGTEMYVLICNTCFADLLGNVFPGNGSGDWSFTTEIVPFELISLDPADKALDASKDSQVTLTFSHDADIGAGNIQVFRASDDNIIAQLNNFNGSFMTIDGPNITFDFTSDFPQGEELYINVSDGYLRSDLTSDDWAGIQDNTSWRFTVEDNRPQIVSFTPTTSDLAPAFISLEVTFDRDIALTTSTIPALRVYNSLDQQVAFFNKNSTISINGATAEFTINYLLDSDESYYVQMVEGLFVDIADASNGSEPIDDNTTWTFATRANDANGPDLVSLSPANSETHVPRGGLDVDFTMTFDEPVYLGNTNDRISLYRDEPTGDQLVYDIGDPGVISISSDNLTVTLDILNHMTLQSEKEHYILIDNLDASDNPIIFDADGNGIAAISDENEWRFTTIGPLAITEFTPVNGATDVPVDQVFTFKTNNELILSSSGTIRLRNYETGQIRTTILLPSDDVTVNDNEGSISFANVGGLDEGQHSYIDIANAVFQDAQNSTFSTSHKDTWNFVTEDITAPSITTLFPPDDNDNVLLTTNIVVDFDESIELGSGNITLYNENDEVVETYSATENFSRITVGFNDITIDPTNDLLDGANYYIQIDADAVKDDDGFDNFFAGIADNTTWNFSTPDNTGPAFVSSSPDDEETGVAIDTDIVLTFDEDIIGNVSGSNQIRLLTSAGSLVEVFSDMSRIVVSGNTMTVDPTNDLVSETEYDVFFWHGAAIDAAANSAPAFDFTFTTEDITAPTISILNPNDDATEISTTNWVYTVDFNEDVQAGSGFINLRRYDNDVKQTAANLGQHVTIVDNTATIDFNALSSLGSFELDELTQYYIEIEDGVFEDLSGNAYTGHSKDDWNFITVPPPDVTPPTVVTLSPEDDATDAEVDELLVITFDEDVKLAIGGTTKHIWIRRVSDDVIEEEVFLTSDMISGNQITIPHPSLSESTEYWIWMPNGALSDLSDNLFAGFASNTEWNFTTGDFTPPSVLSLNPTNNATDVSIDADLVMTFDEDVQLTGSGDFTMFNKTTGEQIGAVWFFPAGATVDGNEVTYDIPMDLPYGTEIYFRIQGAIEDLAGNNAENITGTDSWVINTEGELVPPGVTSLSPASGSVDVDITTDLVLAYDEDVVLTGGGTFKMFNKSNDEQIGINWFFPTLASVSDNMVTFDIPIDLPYGTEIYFEITGAIEDVWGNPAVDIIGNSDWFITTEGELIPPNVTSLNPASGSVDVDITTDLILTYDEDVVLTGGGTFKMFNKSTDEQIGPNWFFPGGASVSGNIVTYDIPIDLPVTTEIYFEITNAIEDVWGNAAQDVTGNTNWFITTEKEKIPPSITSLSPSSGSVDVDVTADLLLTYDEDVQLTGAGTFKMFNKSTGEQIGPNWFFPGGASVSGNVVTYDIPIDLPYETEIYFEITNAVEDLVENAAADIVGDSEWVITTMEEPDTTPPSIVSLSPPDNATDVDVTTNLVITFDEPVHVRSGGNILLRTYDLPGLAPYETIEVTSGQVSGSGTTTITIDPASNFDFDFHAFVQIEDDAFEDAAGNLFGGLFSLDDWDFTTQQEPDVTPPSIVSLVPADDQTDVAVDTDFMLTFDEDIQIGSGSIGFHFYSNNSQNQSVDVNDPVVQVSGNTLTINAPLNLMTSVQYWISIPSSAIKDLAGNSFAGISSANKDDWNFTTSATAPDPPLVTLRSPEDQATDVALDVELSLTFDEEIMLAVSGATKQMIIQRVTTPGGNFEVVPITSDLIGGNKLTVPHNEFESGTTYRIFLADAIIADLDNNFFTGFSDPSDWTFTTIVHDTEAPQIVTLTPADNATNVSRTNWSFTIDFNEDVQIGSGTARLMVYDTDGITANAPHSTHITTSGNAATIDFNSTGTLNNSTLNASTRFYLEIPDGLFEDLSGNPYVGHTKDDWDFTTEAEGKSDQTITFDAITDKVFGDESFDLTVSASSGLAVALTVVEGPISIDGTTVTITGAGTATIAANQAGDNDFNAAEEVTQSFDIAKADQQITIDPIADKLTTDNSFDVSATVNSGLELTYDLSGPASILGTTITLDGTSGTVTVTVSQSGNDNYNAASASTSFIVSDPAKSDQTITFETVEDRTFGDAPFDLVASSSSGLTVRFTVVSGPVSLDGTTVTINGAGSVTIAANQSGDNDFNPAAEVTQSFDIAKADQSITIEAIDDKLTTNNPFDIVATTSSGLELTYEVSGPASINGTLLSLDGTAGTVTVTVSQEGNENYNSASASTTFEVAEESALAVRDDLIEVKFYPNPVKDFLIIESNSSISVRLFDSQGKLITQDLSPAGKLDLRSVINGIYLLEVLGNGQKIHKRIVKAN